MPLQGNEAAGWLAFPFIFGLNVFRDHLAVHFESDGASFGDDMVVKPLVVFDGRFRYVPDFIDATSLESVLMGVGDLCLIAEFIGISALLPLGAEVNA